MIEFVTTQEYELYQQVSKQTGTSYGMIWNWKVNFCPKDEIKAAPQDFISPEESSKTNVGGGR